MNNLKHKDLKDKNVRNVHKNFKAILIGYIALILVGIFEGLLFWQKMTSDREAVFNLILLMGYNLFLYFLLDSNIQKLRNLSINE